MQRISDMVLLATYHKNETIITKKKMISHESVNLDIQAGKVHYYYKIKPVNIPVKSFDNATNNQSYRAE